MPRSRERRDDWSRRRRGRDEEHQSRCSDRRADARPGAAAHTLRRSCPTLRVASTTQQRLDGGWRERSNYIDVELFGAQAESAAQHLVRGRQIAVDGRLEWREYEGGDGVKRQVHRIVADSLQFLPDARAASAGRAAAEEATPA